MFLDEYFDRASGGFFGMILLPFVLIVVIVAFPFFLLSYIVEYIFDKIDMVG